jgi:extracellular factor (EF) 3-hydroxypalmitic acid methyl ester biosynthesis protein
VYTYTSNTEAAQAVRERRHIISEKIDDVARKKPQAHILSLACGHLREAISCRALREGKLGRYVAVDQDQKSLAVVAREAGSLGVETVAASVHDLLKGRVAFANLDFVYAAGLYDYLSFPIARRLTEILFAMLNPGGRMFIANFLPNRTDAGYMEAYLDWWLMYRTEADMLALSETLPARHVATRSTFLDTHATIAFLEVLKKI